MPSVPIPTRQPIEESLAKMIDAYVGTQVTDVLLNVNYQRTAYASRVWESFWDVEDQAAMPKDQHRAKSPSPQMRYQSWRGQRAGDGLIRVITAPDV